MKKKFPFLKILIIIILCLSGAFLIFKCLLEYRRSNLYVDYPSLSVDGKSFLVKRIYNFDIGAALLENSDITYAMTNYTSTGSPGTNLLRFKSNSYLDPFTFACMVKNGDLYMLLDYVDQNPNAKTSNNPFGSTRELHYYPKKGSPQFRELPLNCHGTYTTPCNIIAIDEKTGFYHYEPLKNKLMLLCKFPDFKKESEEYLSSLNPPDKSAVRPVNTAALSIFCGFRPGDFVLHVPFSTVSDNDYSLFYIYSANSNKLTRTDKLSGWNKPETAGAYYASIDDRFIQFFNTDIIIDTTVPEIVNLKDQPGRKDYKFFNDKSKTYKISTDGSDVFYAESLDGVSRSVYHESRAEHIVYDIFWFPTDNCIIAQIKLYNSLCYSPDGLTEIIAIDPLTGQIRQITSPCPVETKKNNKIFTFFYGLSVKAHELRSKIPYQYRKYF
jgi:hypothetical protein